MVINPENDIEQFASELSSRYPNPIIRADGTRDKYSDGHIVVTDGGITSLKIEPHSRMRWKLSGELHGDYIDEKIFDNMRSVESFLDDHFDPEE